MRAPRRLVAIAFSCAALIGGALSGCAAWEDGPGYWWQSASGQLELVRRAQPIPELIDDPATDPLLRERLIRAVEIREFASRELGLPDNDSYTRYADLGRPYVVWNVFAAPALSLKLRKWCFPVAGCVSYRGFFDRDDAERFAQRMREEGYEAYVGGVPAYSTLGWFSDPLLNTFVAQHEVEVARLIFHELAHQRLYVSGDSAFNESFATAVERIGVERWLAAREAVTGDSSARLAWQARSERRADFLALLRRHRGALSALFASPSSDEDKLAGRERIFAEMRDDYALLRQRWGGFAGYDRWFAQPLTTAHLASVATYTDLVPAFESLLAREGGDLARFYQAAVGLSDLPALERSRTLAALAGPTPIAASAPPVERQPEEPAQPAQQAQQARQVRAPGQSRW
ncbi:MAG TPA: aminopeptidase [Burkholderiaceae bacterium]|nr:aminopeptidase [Burkholderiaceae bacterium]